jgi:hypothetical protein
MTNPFDPTIVHPGECRTCYGFVRDNETMTDGECADCVAAAVDDEAPVEFDREMFDLRVRAEWEIG